MEAIQNTGVSAPALATNSGSALAEPQRITHHSPLTSQQWGMIAFLVSEAAFFSTLIVVYLAFLGADQSGPTPAVLSLPLVIVTTACLLSSSVTVHLAGSFLRAGVRSHFIRLCAASILLGSLFLGATHEE